MKPLPFELPAVICHKAGAEQRENEDTDGKNPDDHLLSKIIAMSPSGKKQTGAVPKGIFSAPPNELMRFCEFESGYRLNMKQLHKKGAAFYYIETPRSLSEARAALLAAKKTFSGPAIISFRVDEEGMTEFGCDAMALYIIAEGMGAAAFGLRSDDSAIGLLEVLKRIAPYARIPLMAVGDSGRTEELFEKIPQMGLFLCDSELNKAPFSLLRNLKRPMFCEKDPELILAASGMEAFFVDATIDFSQEIECTSDFPEDVLQAEDEGGGLKIQIRNEDDIDILEQYQYMIRRPVCFCSDHPGLMEGALKAYNGRAFFDGTCDIEEHYLKYLQEFYGLIIL